MFNISLLTLIIKNNNQQFFFLMVKKTIIIFKQQFLRKLNLYLMNYDVMEHVHDDDDLNDPKILHRPIFLNWCLLPIKNKH